MTAASQHSQGVIMNSKDVAASFVVSHPDLFKRDWSWFDKNWHVVLAFEYQALKLIEHGRTHYSARTIVEVLVHESIIREVEGDYKIGNDNAPDLARIFVVLHPQHLTFWEYRRENHVDFEQAIDGMLPPADFKAVTHQ